MGTRRLGLAYLLAVLLVVVGCGGSSEVVPDLGDVEADVQAGADAASLAGPSAEISSGLIEEMLVLAAGSAVRAGTCPGSFELPSGVAGTCTTGEAGSYTFTFEGQVLVAGRSVTVQGTFVATPASDPPAGGSAYLVDFDAIASGPRGTATWSVLGTITLDGSGQVSDFELTMTHTLTPAGGGPTVQVTAIVDPTRCELVVTGPHGGVLRFVLDRETMTGSVSWNGRLVASISITAECTTIDFVDSAIDDRTICAE